MHKSYVFYFYNIIFLNYLIMQLFYMYRIDIYFRFNLYIFLYDIYKFNLIYEIKQQINK